MTVENSHHFSDATDSPGGGGGGTHSMKVTIYAPPFRSPFSRSLGNLYSFDPYILAKMRKRSYFDPYLSSKLSKMYSFDPLYLTLVAFRVDGRWEASLSETWPSIPPPPPPPYTHTPHPPPPPPINKISGVHVIARRRGCAKRLWKSLAPNRERARQSARGEHQ